MLCFSMPPPSLSLDQRATDTGLSPSKRPKLSLQTSCERPRSFGKSTATLNPVNETNSPTVRNTYLNTCFHSSASSASASTTRPGPSLVRSCSPSPSTTPNPLIPRACSPFNSAGWSDAPYKQPLGVRSILRNSPLPRMTPRSTTSLRTPRLLFKPAKRAAFKNPLCEEVRTAKYLLAHFDLFRPDDQEDNNSNVEEKKKKKEVDAASRAIATEGSEPTPVSSTSMEDEGGCTPGTQGSRQRREWAWTLGPPPPPPAPETDAIQDDERPKVSEEGTSTTRDGDDTLPPLSLSSAAAASSSSALSFPEEQEEEEEEGKGEKEDQQ